jgi:hypothetical protein
MVPQFSFGLMFEMTASSRKGYQDYSFAKNKNISVAAFLQNNSLESQFHLPLSEQAFQEYHQLQQIIHQTQVSENSKE